MTFSNTEKQLVREIVQKNKPIFFQNLIDSHISNGFCIYVDSETSQLQFDNNIDTDEAIKESEKLYRLIVSLLFLLDSFEHDKLIYTLKISSATLPKKFGKCDANQVYSTIDLFDDINWLGKLEYYLTREIIASVDLILLVDNQFFTDEERKFKKQFIATWIGIILAFLGAMASPFIQKALENRSNEIYDCRVNIYQETKFYIDKNSTRCFDKK